MRRVVLLFAGLLVVAPVLVAAAPAGASPARHATAAGTYSVYVDWNGAGWQAAGAMTLKRNHTGSDAYGDSAKWSLSAKTITITWSNSGGVAAVYVGKKVRAGISSLQHPGSMSTPGGAKGIWYAVTG